MRLTVKELRKIISEEINRLLEIRDDVGQLLFSAERMLRDLMEEDESPNGWERWAKLWDTLVVLFKRGVISLGHAEKVSAEFGFEFGNIDVELIYDKMSKVPTMEWRSARSGRDIFFTEDIEVLSDRRPSNVVSLFN